MGKDMNDRNIQYKLENVIKTFKTATQPKLPVLKGINYSIYESEFISIIGPSGCGKSTLLNIMAGLISTTHGRVLLKGKEVTGPGRELGMIFQQDVIFLWRTVLKNVEFGLEIQNIEKQKREEIAMEYIQLVGLEEFKNYYPKELSGGMRKRVAIAMVLANKPEVFLMDEPFGSLDYITKITLQKEILKIWGKEKITTIFVTHDIEEALFLSNKVLVLLGGVIQDTVNVPFSYPRDDSLRTSNKFQKMKEQLWKYMIPEN